MFRLDAYKKKDHDDLLTVFGALGGAFVAYEVAVFLGLRPSDFGLGGGGGTTGGTGIFFLVKDGVGPVSGASVILDQGTDQAAVMTTGLDGKANFPSARAGNHTVDVTAPGYVNPATQILNANGSTYTILLAPVGVEIVVLGRQGQPGQFIFLPLQGASVILDQGTDQAKVMVTDVQGKTIFGGVSGNHLATILATGFVSQTITVNSIGTFSVFLIPG